MRLPLPTSKRSAHQCIDAVTTPGHIEMSVLVAPRWMALAACSLAVAGRRRRHRLKASPRHRLPASLHDSFAYLPSSVEYRQT